MSKRWSLLAVALTTAVALPLMAGASHVDVTDGNDTPGLLDVRTVKVSGQERPVWNVITFRNWDVERIFDRGYFLIRLNTFGGERFDYYALVRSNGFSMKGTLVRDRASKPDYNVGKLDAWHPRADRVLVRIPLAKMRIGNRRVSYSWQVQTLFSSNSCPRVCIDDVPDARAVVEPLPGAPMPTPTVTSSPTPTPTTSP